MAIKISEKEFPPFAYSVYKLFLQKQYFYNVEPVKSSKLGYIGIKFFTYRDYLLHISKANGNFYINVYADTEAFPFPKKFDEIEIQSPPNKYFYDLYFIMKHGATTYMGTYAVFEPKWLTLSRDEPMYLYIVEENRGIWLIISNAD